MTSTAPRSYDLIVYMIRHANVTFQIVAWELADCCQYNYGVNPHLSAQGKQECELINFEDSTLSGIKQVISSPLYRAVEIAVKLFQESPATEQIGEQSSSQRVKIVIWPELVGGLRSGGGGEGDDPVELQTRYNINNVDQSHMKDQAPQSQRLDRRVLAVEDWLLQQRPLGSNGPYEVAVVTHSAFIEELLPGKY